MPKEMDDSEIEEKLRRLGPKQLLKLVQALSRDATLSDERRQEMRELSLLLTGEINQNEQAADRLLREKGGQMIQLINQLLQDKTLSDDMRKKLETLPAAIAGYLMRDWLPVGLFRKILMILFLIIGVIGVLNWSLWFGLLIIFAAMFSPRIAGTVLHFSRGGSLD